MIRGTVSKRAGACGNSAGRCTCGELHRCTYLSVSVGGLSQQLPLPFPNEQRAQEATSSYRRFRQAKKHLVELGAEQMSLVDPLGNALLEPYKPDAPLRKSRRRRKQCAAIPVKTETEYSGRANR